ncbi:MAG: PAS domain S-box protein [Syntrophales bacterium]|nr:PAS domain S-box protein [Syntrophales bacterium]
MKKPPGRDAAASEKRRKDTATKRPAGNHPAPKTPRNRTFDPDSLLNCMDGMVYVASPDYRIEYMNDAALRRVGRDMTGKRCFKVFHGLEAPCSWCVAELVRQGQTFRMEIQGQLDRRWYSSVLTPLPRRDGTVSVQALVFDITDQKQAQAALSQNEALLRSIIQAAPTGIGMVKNRVIEWTNEQITQITGYTPGELKGKSARILYPSDEEFDRVGRHKYAEIRSRGTGSIVTAWQRKDGSTANIFLSSTPIDPGDLSAGVVFTALDITEKKKVQDELWRSEEKYRALFENAVMGIFQSTPDGRFLSVNPATAKMCGFDSPEEMVDSVTDIGTALSGISSTARTARTGASSGFPSTRARCGTGRAASRTTRGPTRTSRHARKPRRPCGQARSASKRSSISALSRLPSPRSTRGASSR